MKIQIFVIFAITIAYSLADVIEFRLDVDSNVNLIGKVIAPLKKRSDLLNNRIINGKPAALGQFPWQAGLYITKSDGNYICGGSLLNQAWVLTAAHCTIGATKLLVRLGSTNFDSGVPIYADKYLQHVGYDPNTLENDISFIHMAANVALSSNIQPIRVPAYSQASTTFTNTKALVSGFGTTRTGGSASSTLNYANVNIISNTDCSTYYGNTITGNTICTTGDGSIQGTCSGDSGGPLVINESGTYTLVGIVSFVSGLGCEAGPAGYLRTQKYLQMISNIAGVTIRS